ncbi:tryptophan--tRNA ligase [Victivallis sp. Marseille-Q1083]|uniref:tryptophan--tRNA ligase n=1 Tax=Victivallis sp. Marseille-Q1083 TaxID=2717288 RepID=UPI00158F059C|nr:tryptophan--tRNA ligase [Victivallis sp. Marseille-Q1083]
MRVLSGVQPSGTPHIGNYFGMMKPALELQQQGEAFLFIADYHALTTSPEPSALRERTIELAVDFLACGLNPDKTVFFRQSDVPQVTELTWILNNITTVGLLERAHSYKDKVAKGFIPNNGLFSYPVLMASDILIYQSNIVPVGRDQKQHLEITRDLAVRFNNTYGDIFTIPEGFIQESVAVVPGTDGQKMSKSYNNIIPIFDKEKAIRKTIMNVVTDCKGLEDPKDPDSCNVVALYKLMATPEQLEEMRAKYRAGNYGYGHAKQALFEVLWDYFAPMRKRREELLNNLDFVHAVLRKGAARAREEADKTMELVRRAVGLR